MINLSVLVEDRIKRNILWKTLCFLDECLKRSSENTFGFCNYVIDNVNPVTVKEHDGFVIDVKEKAVCFKCGVFGYVCHTKEYIEDIAFTLNMDLCALMQIAKYVCELVNNYKIGLIEIDSNEGVFFKGV